MMRVLEVGGTHLTAALVDPDALTISTRHRVDIDSDASADALLRDMAQAVEALAAPGVLVAVAIPGPFDYARGIGDFEGVSKFGALRGVPVGERLAERLGSQLVFLNDVTAYALGQYALLDHPPRLVALTLGTGVGSAFLAGGVPVTSGSSIPDNGWVYTLEFDDRPIEETFSRRAIMAAHAARTGRELDVKEISERARGGDPDARAVLHHALGALATTVAPWLVSFRASCLVIGGSIANAWDARGAWFVPIVEAEFDRHRLPIPSILPGHGGEDAALIGAARYAQTRVADH